MGPKVLRDALLVVMAACGGGLDAAGYLRLHAFSANMTGNTILLGLALGGRHLAAVWPTAVALAAFCVGAFLGSIAGGEATEENPWPAEALRAFAIEIVLLVALAVGWDALGGDPQTRVLALVAIAACAMGVQSGIVHDVHHHGASTTYMSGTLARIFEYAADTLRFGFRGGLVLNAVTWVVYLASAFTVGVLDFRGAWLGGVLWTVVVAIAAVALAGRPIVMAAEREARLRSRSPQAQ